MWWYRNWSLKPRSSRSAIATKARRRARPAAVSAARVTTSLRGARAREDGCVTTGALGARGGPPGLVVLLLDVHGPDVVVRAEEVLHREHRGEHRVILVVVLVHPV